MGHQLATGEDQIPFQGVVQRTDSSNLSDILNSNFYI